MYTIMFLTIFGAVASSPLTKEKDDVRIVGGENIDITTAPYQASILYAGRHSCGGSIISNDLILTAAHCVTSFSYNPNDYLIRVGSSSSYKGGLLYRVEKIIVHPKFSHSTLDYDIALMQLSKYLRFSERIAPIKLLEEGEEILDGVTTAVTGWGNLKEGGGFPSTLQMVQLPVVNPTVCKNAYIGQYTITTNMLCAGLPEGGKDSCQGDSGGPLAYNERLAGVVSWGLGCARAGYPGVYTKVSALRRWIDFTGNNLRENSMLKL